MKTFSMVLAIGCVGCLLATGAMWRSERVRAAYRIRSLSDRLSHAKNENGWLRGEIARKREPRLLMAVSRKKSLAPMVMDVPVIKVAPRAHAEVPPS